MGEFSRAGAARRAGALATSAAGLAGCHFGGGASPACAPTALTATPAAKVDLASPGESAVSPPRSPPVPAGPRWQAGW